jgi:hypothetical protein
MNDNGSADLHLPQDGQLDVSVNPSNTATTTSSSSSSSDVAAVEMSELELVESSSYAEEYIGQLIPSNALDVADGSG